MGFNPKQLQDTAQRIQERACRLVQDRKWQERQIENAVTVVVPALVAGISAAKSKPGSRSTARFGKKTKIALVAFGAGSVALQPVAGSIEVAVAAVRTPILRLVDRRITSKRSRFVLMAGIMAASIVVGKKTKQWAEQQPRLKEIEDLGLSRRLKDRAGSKHATDLDELRASLRQLSQDPKAFASDLEEMLDLLKRRRPQPGGSPEWNALKEAGRRKREARTPEGS